jgi:hypothetical protein
MNLDLLKMIFLNTAAAVIPFLLGGLVLIAAVSYSPLGRLWIGYLRQRKRDSEALEAMLEETAGLRAVLGEVVERLDATERRLALGALPSPTRNQAELPTTEIRTPT